MNAANYDPLRYLPYELWVKCIGFYAREQPEGALPLLLVSLDWQTCLLETQELWDTIYLDGGHDELCRAECFFHLSRDLPIELVLDNKSQAVEVVIRHRDRINSLVFCARSPGDLYKSDDILRYAEALDGYQYPNLGHICVEPPCPALISIPHNLIEACPALIGIHGGYIVMETISIPPALTNNLGVFTAKALPEGLGDRIQILRIRHSSSDAQKAGRSRCFTAPSTQLTSFELHYGFRSNKKSFSNWGPLSDERSQYLSSLKGFTSTTHRGLKILSITMPWYEISRLVPVLSTSTVLRELELIVDPAVDPPQPGDIAPPIMSEIGHVQKLSLYIQSGSRSQNHLFAPNLRRFLKLFIDGNALGQLEKLHLEFIRHQYKETLNSEVLGLLQVTRSLTELHLIGTRLAGVGSTRILLSRLHTLAGGLSAVRCLEMPNLACLTDNDVSDHYYDPQTLCSSAEILERVTMRASLFYQWNDELAKAESIGNTFPRLTTLRLAVQDTYFDPLFIPNFPNLQSITFDDKDDASHNSEQRFKRHLLDHFMLEIVFAPDICPRLHTIRAAMYPNCALTIAMLRRRNSLLKTVTPIHSFWLPGYPQITMSSLISRAFDTPTEDNDVNMDAASRADTTIKLRWELDFFRRQACKTCIMSGYVACPSNNSKTTTGEPPANRSSTKLLDLDAVAMSESQFETWDRSRWKAYLKPPAILPSPKGTYFKKRCNRHDLKNLVHIGPQTLAGATYDFF